jgi:hypothetical protein
MVEQDYGLDVLDAMISRCELATNGAYTAVGTYDYREFLQLITALGDETGKPVPRLVRAFGHFLFNSFLHAYPEFLEGIYSATELLRSVQSTIHVEVRKLYPESELPEFEFAELSYKSWQLTYRSKRPFAELAHGLIEAAVLHYGDPVTIDREDLEPNGTHARFVLTIRQEVPLCVR